MGDSFPVALHLVVLQLAQQIRLSRFQTRHLLGDVEGAGGEVASHVDGEGDDEFLEAGHDAGLAEVVLLHRLQLSPKEGDEVTELKPGRALSRLRPSQPSARSFVAERRAQPPA